MVSDEALKKLQEQIAAWPMTQRFVVQQLIRDYLRNREDLRAYEATGLASEEGGGMMERLTFDGNFCDIAQCDVIPGGSYCESGSCTQRKVWERLKAYEDTGLTPERCAEFARADAEGRYIVMRDAEQEGVARLRELAEADKDGRLVVLPCKVGEKLWVIGRDNVPREIALEAPDIRTVCTDEDNFCMSTCNRKPDGFCAYRLRNDGADVGKTVFLTYEEAEKALEAKNSGMEITPDDFCSYGEPKEGTHADDHD